MGVAYSGLDIVDTRYGKIAKIQRRKRGLSFETAWHLDFFAPQDDMDFAVDYSRQSNVLDEMEEEGIRDSILDGMESEKGSVDQKALFDMPYEQFKAKVPQIPEIDDKMVARLNEWFARYFSEKRPGFFLKASHFSTPEKHLKMAHYLLTRKPNKVLMILSMFGAQESDVNRRVVLFDDNFSGLIAEMLGMGHQVAISKKADDPYGEVINRMAKAERRIERMLSAVVSPIDPRRIGKILQNIGQ